MVFHPIGFSYGTSHEQKPNHDCARADRIRSRTVATRLGSSVPQAGLDHSPPRQVLGLGLGETAGGGGISAGVGGGGGVVVAGVVAAGVGGCGVSVDGAIAGVDELGVGGGAGAASEGVGLTGRGTTWLVSDSVG